MALGLAVGLALGLAGAAFAASATWRDGDHYEMGWTVLVAGKAICTGPFVRPFEREIECRTAVAPP
jgi:hypothetical protein